ncbi:MAG: metal-dependent phosphohydrolase [Acidimicrobiia bacterium]
MEPGVAREQWLADVGRSTSAEAALDELLARYREPHRRYHGELHVHRVVSDVTELLRTVPTPDAAAVRLAAWYHDAVYEPRAVTNEQASAELARRTLGELGIDLLRTAEVARLILLTAAHEPVDLHADPPAAVLLDADLAVLGADAAAYAAYARGVRVEYRHVDDAAWRTGRAAVLRRFLDAEHIYSTPAMRERESRARANLAAELSTLEA